MTFELLAAMAARFPDDEWRVLLPGRAGNVPPAVRAYRTRLPSRVLFGAAALTGRPRLDSLLGGIDVAWLPAPAPIALSPAVPRVLTLHDLSWVQRPQDFTPYERAWHLLARPCSQAKRAAWVTTVSDHTRRVAIERWGLEPSRVVVVPPAVGVGPGSGGTAENGSGRTRAGGAAGGRYFLWVGALEPRKAPEVLEAAWRQARGRGLAADLIVVGEGRVPLTGPGVEHRGRVSDGELGALYAGALALVMPTRLEGCGLTPLEAALHGTPSICSDLTVLRESLGSDGAEWVTPGRPEALAEALLEMAADPAHRKLIAAAAAQAAAAHVDPVPSAERMRALLADAAQTRPHRRRSHERR